LIEGRLIISALRGTKLKSTTMEVLRVSEAKSENRMPGIVEVGVLAISTLSPSSSSAPAPARDTCDQTVGLDISGCKEVIMSTMKFISEDPKELTDSQFKSYTKTLMNKVEELIVRTHEFGDRCVETAQLREREKAYLYTLDIIEEMWMVLEKRNIIAYYSNKNGDKGAALNTLATEVEDSLLDKTIRHMQEMNGSLGDNGLPEKIKDKMDKFKEKLPRTAGLIDERRKEKEKDVIFSLDHWTIPSV